MKLFAVLQSSKGMKKDKEQNAGIYEINFDASNLPEGAYFYTIELKGVNSTYYSKTTKNLLLVK